MPQPGLDHRRCRLILPDRRTRRNQHARDTEPQAQTRSLDHGPNPVMHPIAPHLADWGRRKGSPPGGVLLRRKGQAKTDSITLSVIAVPLAPWETICPLLITAIRSAYITARLRSWSTAITPPPASA